MQRDIPVWVLAALFACAAALTVKYFPGFENETAYAGNAFQWIHPDAFAGDAYQGPEKPLSARPFQLSLIYPIIGMTGEIWLDDRFVALVYVVLVFMSLFGLERIAHHVGLTDPIARLAVILLFLKDHQILENKVLVAHHPDVNHFAFAIPIIIWLLYAALARKGWIVVLGLSVLLTMISIRNAVGPIFFAFCVQAVLGGRRDRVAVGVMFAAGAAVAYVGLFHVVPVADEHRLILWDILRAREAASANPWHDISPQVLVQNATWLCLIAVAVAVCARATHMNQAALRGLAVILVAGLIIWMVGGLYISFAPDAVKQPLLIGLAPTRMLAWPQTLAMLVIAAWIVGQAERLQTPRSLAVAGAGILVLYLLGPGDPALWFAVCGIAGVAAVLGGGLWARPRSLWPGAGDVMQLAVSRPAVTVCAALALTSFVALGAAARDNAAAWRTWAEQGVFGNAASAVWIGVDTYIREDTPKDASVLPYYRRFDGRLKARRSLGTRTGRAMPVPEGYSDVRDPNVHVTEAEQSALIDSIGKHLDAGETEGVQPLLQSLVQVPDRIIVPSDIGRTIAWDDLGYVLETEVANFTVARRR